MNDLDQDLKTYRIEYRRVHGDAPARSTEIYIACQSAELRQHSIARLRRQPSYDYNQPVEFIDLIPDTPEWSAQQAEDQAYEDILAENREDV